MNVLWIPFIIVGYGLLYTLWKYGWHGALGVAIFLGSLVGGVWLHGHFSPRRPGEPGYQDKAEPSNGRDHRPGA